jgi:hypothetical protein
MNRNKQKHTRPLRTCECLNDEYCMQDALTDTLLALYT